MTASQFVGRQWNSRIRYRTERRDSARRLDCVKLRLVYVTAKYNARGRRFDAAPSIFGADDIVPSTRAACIGMHIKAVVIGCRQRQFLQKLTLVCSKLSPSPLNRCLRLRVHVVAWIGERIVVIAANG
jgi:hypothetical protein